MQSNERFIAIPNVFWKGEADVDKNLQASKFIIFWACVALVSLVLSGCGGKDGEFPFFTDDDTEETLTTSVLSQSFAVSPETVVQIVAGLGDAAAAELAAGDSTKFAIQINRPLGADLDVQLATVDPASILLGMPESVTIPAGEVIGLVTVAVAEEAVPGNEAEIALIPVPDYGVVGEASAFKVLVSTVPVATLTLSGGDYSAVPGELVLYSLDRSTSTGDVSVPLLVTGDVASFEVPMQLSFTDGSTSVTFAVKASGTAGIAQLTFLPPQGYGLGAEPSVRLEILPN
jgi:hypothetical protein